MSYQQNANYPRLLRNQSHCVEQEQSWCYLSMSDPLMVRQLWVDVLVLLKNGDGNKVSQDLQSCAWPLNQEHTAQFQIMNFSRLGLVRFGMVTVLSIVWPRSLFSCPFHKKLIIWDEKSFGFCQTGNPQFSFIMYCYTYRQLTCRNLELSEFSFS